MRNLIIVLSEKEPDTKHICFEGGCPFHQQNQKKSSICRTLWENPPAHIDNPLASLCNYYDTKNVTIAEVDGDLLNDFFSLTEKEIEPYKEEPK